MALVAEVWTAERARRRLLWGIALFVVAAGAPLALLIKHVGDQLRMEAYLSMKIDAEDLAGRIERRAQDLLAEEENRGFEEFGFLNVVGKSLQLSPLSRAPADSRLPGLVGHFQIDPAGRVSTPLLPSRELERDAGQYGLDDAERARRQTREDEIKKILDENEVTKDVSKLKAAVDSKAAGNEKASAWTTKDDTTTYDELELDSELNVGSISNTLTQRTKKESAPEVRKYKPRSQEASIPVEGAADGAASGRVRTLRGDIDPFQFTFLPSGNPVLFRKVWREGQRFVQGALMDRDKFLDELFRQTYDSSPVSGVVYLGVEYAGRRLLSLEPLTKGAPARTLVARKALAAPFDGIELVFTVDRVVTGPNVSYALGVCVVLVFVLVAGVLAIYLSGRRQIALSQQQRDFVSAVSHELKTPLTSIRMYSEMLREGWTSEEKKRSYYDFIFSESERLSRLIANVLQLARLTRGQPLALRAMSAGAAYAQASAVVATQVMGAGFTRREHRPEGDGPLVNADADALTQIFVNLVDNGIKFSKKTEQTVIETGFEVSKAGSEVRFFVRDFGPGIPRDQLKRIFKLFYRPENELTRTTKGTGIGLALVQEMAAQMGGRVDVESRPGHTEFRVILPAVRPLSPSA